jgi:ABC-2 type transport system permease protein/lipopolysaccharide transport system permease protein
VAVNARLLPDRRFFDVVVVLLSRALKTRYRGSVLGVFWSAIGPLAMSAVYAAIFGRTFAGYYGGSLVEYAAAVYIGLTLIGFFVGGTTQALPSIIANAALLNKIRIPYEAFPLAILAAYGVQQVIGSLPLIAITSLAINHNPLHVIVLAVPLFSVALLSVGVGFFVSATCVYFRDIPYLYELATFFLWVTTPVFYPAAIVPHPILAIIEWNPLFAIIESSRTLVLTTAYPSAAMLATSIGTSALVFVAGLWAFRLMRGQFMDLL